MQRCNFLSAVPTQRATGKKADPANVFKLLAVFALAAWLEMIERWWNMPTSPERHLKMVCNVTPLDLFTLGQLVREEREFSALPLTDHICAMCGRLLQPPSATAHLKRDIGIPGLACQVRGETEWHALPLFLMLWSKKTHAARLQEVFTYDAAANTLCLTRGTATAPWLHFKTKGRGKFDATLPTRRRKELSLDVAKPWWFCHVCYPYWFSKTQERVPMRNWLEGMYTRWHLDIGFSHLLVRSQCLGFCRR